MRASHESLNLPKPVVGWIHNHAAKNYWRVANWCELDDLIQDGLLVAYKCKTRYGRPGKDIDHPHFMALVKTAFYNHIAEMLRHSRAEQETVVRLGDAVVQVDGEMSDDAALDRLAPAVPPDQDFVAILARLPETLRRAIELYLTNPEEMRREAGRRHEQETDAQKLCRLIGFPLRHDFEAELRAELEV